MFELLDEEKKREEAVEAFSKVNNEKSPKTVFEQVALRNKKENKNSKALLITLISAVLAVMVALILLGSYLSVYKENAPVTVCDEILLAFKEKDAEPLLKYSTNLPRILSYKKNLTEYLHKYLPDDEYEYFEVASFNPRDKKYLFKAGDITVAEIIFGENKEKASYSVKSYFVKSFELKSLTSYKIITNSNFDLFVNGEVVSPRYLFSKLDIAPPINNFTEKGITQDIYYIEELFYIADIKAYDRDGRPCDINFDANLMQYEISRNANYVKENLTDFINNFLPEYSNYILVDNSENKNILKYIHKHSYLYNIIKNYEFEEDYDYSESKTDSLALTDFTCYGNNFFSVNASAVFELSDRKDEKTKVGFDKKIYFILEKEKFYVIDIVESA